EDNLPSAWPWFSSPLLMREQGAATTQVGCSDPSTFSQRGTRRVTVPLIPSTPSVGRSMTTTSKPPCRRLPRKWPASQLRPSLFPQCLAVRPSEAARRITMHVHYRELSLAELLDDPLVHLLMASDGVKDREL